MYSISAALTVVLSGCAASPLSQRAPLNSSALQTGLPIGDLFTSNFTSTLVGNLELPIGPWVLRDYQTRFNFAPTPVPGAPARAFVGGDLIKSILFQTVKVWRDVANAPIIHDIEARDGPFGIWHTIEPARIGSRTAYASRSRRCLLPMMERALSHDWPFHIMLICITMLEEEQLACTWVASTLRIN